MAEYNTEQRRQLITFLEKHYEKSLSIDEWIELMKEENGEDIPSRTTVYRTVSKLDKEGQVICTRQGRHASFQIARCPSNDHLHLKCIGCGKLFHMSHEASLVLENSVLNDNKFDIDHTQTVIYGKCVECK